jgi:hypothetical protein
MNAIVGLNDYIFINVKFYDLKSLAFRRPLQYVGVIVAPKGRLICETIDGW